MLKFSKKKILLIVLIFLVMIAGFMFWNIDIDVDEILADTNIGYVDLSNLENGIYNGRHSAGLVEVELAVNIDNGKIIDIQILNHDNWRGGKAEKIVNEVVNKQSLDVDLVSGATISSKVIIKSVENALSNGKRI